MYMFIERERCVYIYIYIYIHTRISIAYHMYVYYIDIHVCTCRLRPPPGRSCRRCFSRIASAMPILASRRRCGKENRGMIRLLWSPFGDLSANDSRKASHQSVTQKAVPALPLPF